MISASHKPVSGSVQLGAIPMPSIFGLGALKREVQPLNPWRRLP